MRVLDFGSLNVDYVYSVPHMIRGGETLLSRKLEVFAGGKGLNQAIALAKAGVEVYMAGQIGDDGGILLDECQKYGVRTDFIRTLPGKGGHTIIQVDDEGQNSIILCGGTNRQQSREHMDAVLAHFGEGDFLVLQNEINLLDYLIDRAYERGMRIVLNPSPFDENLATCDLHKVWLFMLNEIEGEQITGEQDPEVIIQRLQELFPDSRFVLTLGSRGAIYAHGEQKIRQEIFRVKAVDTTAAGDTFTGFFMAGVLQEKQMEEALRLASAASAIAVSRPGAAPSVPTMEEVGLFISSQRHSIKGYG